MGNTLAIHIILDEEETEDYLNGLGKKLKVLYDSGQVKSINVIKTHKFIEMGEKYDKFMLDLEESSQDNLIIIYAELFEGICDIDDMNEANEILGNMLYVAQLEKIIPSIDFMYDTGSKRYVLNDKFSCKMLPGTYTYPKNEDIISGLPKSKYIIKFGFTAESKGIEIADNHNGKDLLKYLKYVENITLDNKPNDFMDEGVKCKDNIAIIQPLSDLFDKCYEIRFGVLDGNIIGIKIANVRLISTKIQPNGILDDDELSPIEAGEIWEKLETMPDDIEPFDIHGYNIKNVEDYFKRTCVPKRGTKVYTKPQNDGGEVIDRNLYYKNEKYSAYAFKLNSKLYKFIKDIANDINFTYPGYIYARIDVIYKCAGVNYKEATKTHSQVDFVYENEINNIYLNEIDNIASGYKSIMSKVIDNGNCAWIHILRNDEFDHIEDEGVYNKIDEYIIQSIVR